MLIHTVFSLDLFHGGAKKSHSEQTESDGVKGHCGEELYAYIWSLEENFVRPT